MHIEQRIYMDHSGLLAVFFGKIPTSRARVEIGHLSTNSAMTTTMCSKYRGIPCTLKLDPEPLKSWEF